MIKVGDKFPDFKVKATVDNNLDKAFIDVTESSFSGQWKVFFFWPKDFTFVCPTEIVAFNNMVSDFADRNTVLLGGSTDSEFVHLAWREHNAQLNDLKFPMLADVKRELTEALGILDQNEGVAQRAVFIVDNENVVRFSMVTDLNVGRNPKEVLRVLEALQTGELCPCSWQPGEKTLG